MGLLPYKAYGGLEIPVSTGDPDADTDGDTARLFREVDEYVSNRSSDAIESQVTVRIK